MMMLCGKRKLTKSATERLQCVPIGFKMFVFHLLNNSVRNRPISLIFINRIPKKFQLSDFESVHHIRKECYHCTMYFVKRNANVILLVEIDLFPEKWVYLNQPNVITVTPARSEATWRLVIFKHFSSVKN